MQVLFILLLILFSPTCSKSEDQQVCKPGQCYEILESALISEPENLYKLQLAFFEVASVDRLAFNVCIYLTEETKDFVDFSTDSEWCRDTTCSSDGHRGCWKVSWSSSLLYGAVTSQLFGLDNTLAVQLYMISNHDHNSLIRHYHSSLELHLNGTLPCDRTDASSLDEAVNKLAMWLKAYARAHSKPDSWSEGDKGYITRRYGFYAAEGTESYNSLHIIRLFLLVSFIILNITAQLFVVMLVPWKYCRVIRVLTERGEHAVNSYWSLAIAAAISNILFFSLTFIVHFPDMFESPSNRQSCPFKAFCGNPSIYHDTRISYSVRIATIFLTLFLYIPISVWTLKHESFQPHCLSCCCCCCSCFSQTFRSKTAPLLALWNILVSIQFHIMSVIPICALIIVAPVRAMLALTVYAIFFLFLWLTVAHILELVKYRSHRSGSFVCQLIIQLCTVLALFSLIVIVLTLYILLQSQGAGKGKAPEFIMSLIPPLFLSLLGWYMKRKFLQEDSTSTRNQFEYIPLQQTANEID